MRIYGPHTKDMTNTETYTAEELREMIATARTQTRQADRLNLRECARSSRRQRRELEAMLEAMVGA